MNTVTANFNTTVREMTEMFQWPKCLSEKRTGTNHSAVFSLAVRNSKYRAQLEGGI